MPRPRARVSRSPSSSLPEEEDSEVDEWEQDRQLVQQGTSKQFEQDSAADSDELDEDEDDEDISEEEDGVGQYLEDEGEVMEEDEDEEAQLGKQIAAIPFGSLLKASKKLKANERKQRLAEKVNEDEEESDEQPETSAQATEQRRRRQERDRRRQNEKARVSKHAPMEMSSKRAVGRTRQVVEVPQKPKSRDPRFDSLSGSFKPDLFSSSYSFLSKSQSAELDQLKKTAAAARKNQLLPQEEKDKIEDALQRMQSREISRKQKERDQAALRAWKKEEEGKRKEGKKEFHLKRADKKAVLLRAKFEDLAKDKKQLRKTVEKKRRKIANKDKKAMPNKR